MERIRLSKQEKQVLRMLLNGCAPHCEYPMSTFTSCIRTLEKKGLAKGAWIEGGGLEGAGITRDGRLYISENPNLRNPIDWKWVISISIGIASAIVAFISLFMACSLQQ